MNNRSLIALCDVNNFYVSCERVFNSRLVGKPVIVLSNNDGCAIARSDEAKQLGIEMGTPFFQLKDLIKQYDIQVLSSNYALYGDMSERVQQIIRQYTDSFENYSIDESFFRLPDNDVVAIEQSARLIDQIQTWLGLPVCIGIAPTKTLAKLANRYAKKQKLPSKLHLLSRPEATDALLEKTDVGHIWGIGRRMKAHMHAMGLYSALDLKNASPKQLRDRFSVVVERTGRELAGTECIDFEEMPPKKKQLICSRSFGSRLSDFETISNALAYHITRGCVSLRKQDSHAQSIKVLLESGSFSDDGGIRRYSIGIQLAEPSCNTADFIKAGMLGLRKIFKPDTPYRKTGVCFLDLTDQDERQVSLFEPAPGVGEEPADYNSEGLMQALDAVNQRFGKNTLKFAREGTHAGWTMQSNYKTHAYTTRWDDLLRVQ